MKEKAVESVWDYPRPPKVEAYKGLVEIVHEGITIAKSTLSQRVLETSHPPVFYIPQEDIKMDKLYLTGRKTMCEFKGEAAYWGMNIKGASRPNVAWSYANPRKGYEAITDHLAFYPGKMDACYVDDEKVIAQEGDFYGGWVTSNIRGPFKGGPGTRGW